MLYPYWIESGITSSQCVVWVKVKRLTALANTNIWFAFGNMYATPASNGDSTFLFFDDFLGTSLNSNKWSTTKYYVDAGGTPTVSGGVVSLGSGVTSNPPRAGISIDAYGVLGIQGPKKWRCRAKTPIWGGKGSAGMFHNQFWSLNWPGNGMEFGTDENGFHVPLLSGDYSGSFVPANYLITQIDCLPTYARIFVNDQSVASGSITCKVDSLSPSFYAGNWSSGYPQGLVVSDWVFVAKTAQNEPTISNTSVDPPTAPHLIYPGMLSTVNGALVPFVWSRGTTGASQYWIELATDSLFSFAMRDTSITDTMATLSISGSSTYYWRAKAKNNFGWGTFSQFNKFNFLLTGVSEGLSVPKEYTMSQNYPNPFNPSTVIRYALPSSSHVTLTVFNALGQQVATLVNRNQEAGYHEVKFDGSTEGSGVYFYRIQAGSFVQTKKLLLLR